MPKGRKITEVNKDLLIKSISYVEGKQQLVNRTELYEAVTEHYNCDASVTTKITPSVVYLRIREWGLPVKTPLGKRGRSSIGQTRKTVEKKTRQEKTAKFADNFARMRAEVIDHGREALLPLIDKIEKGSLKARIRLNCLRCVGYESKEVARCTSYACPWFAVRPNAVTIEEQEA